MPYLKPVPDKFLTPEQAKEQREEYRRLYRSQSKMSLVMSILTVICFILLIIALAGCGPSATRKLRRAERLIKKAEESGATWTVDSVMVKVPVFLTETRVDSIIRSLPGDTVILTRDKLRVVYVKLPGDSVYIEGACLADTVFTEVPVTITKVISAPRSNWWRALLIGAAIGAFLVLVVLFVLRR